jgi:hypothetical protein
MIRTNAVWGVQPMPKKPRTAGTSVRTGAARMLSRVVDRHHRIRAARPLDDDFDMAQLLAHAEAHGRNRIFEIPGRRSIAGPASVIAQEQAAERVTYENASGHFGLSDSDG